ncbi:MAG: hypothetical protein IJP70_05510 [Bacteroidales bacterium]|nr:hypothetical protein [Bacteroidales bacterium]
MYIFGIYWLTNGIELIFFSTPWCWFAINSSLYTLGVATGNEGKFLFIR